MRRVREKLVLRVQNGGLTTQHDTEERRESCLISPIFDRNFSLQRGKSFNFISFYVFFHVPRRSESIRVDPGRSDSDWRSELIRSDFCTCLYVKCSMEVRLGLRVRTLRN